jgi:hypothetical protein
VAWENLRGWLGGGGGVRDRELRETRDEWDQVQRIWRASLFSGHPSYEFANRIMTDAMEAAERCPATSLVVALAYATDDVLSEEPIGDIEPRWNAIATDPSAGVDFREMLQRRRRWASDPDRMLRVFRAHLKPVWDAVFEALPETCFNDLLDDGGALFEVPLVELLHDPAQVIGRFMGFAFDGEALRLGLYPRLRAQYRINVLVASGYAPTTEPDSVADRVVYPRDQRNKSPTELADLYLAHTPFREFLDLSVPFDIPDEARLEHCHIVGGTGHGKTQLMQRMIYADLVRAQRERRSVVVIDSQGDLINTLTRLSLFAPGAPHSLADRLVLIDPSDVEYPAALNLFDAHLDRVRGYGPADRERVLNGVIELYETFFGAMLGAELSQKQGVIFRYLARLMLTIPGATIHTLMQLMEDGNRYRGAMAKLDGSARHFFETEFFHPSFTATKKQILRRLWGVLSTPAFERMFAQPTNKLDLFEAIGQGKIVLINTAKDLLKSEGSALLGRFFIGMLAQAALERSTVRAEDRTPTFVYVDEAQEYFDDTVETILNQARKYKVGLTLAHQTLDQLSPRLRAVIHSNTSIKCAGGVSARDARAMAEEMRSDSDFIEGMRRRRDRTEFAVWVKHHTPEAVRLSVPIGFVERQPISTEEEFAELLEFNRARYCGTVADAQGFELARPAAEPAQPAQTPERRDAPTESPPSEDRFEPTEEQPPSTRSARPPPSRPRELGKGGPQHRYLQHLIKGLAEERGFRAVVEAATEGGQIDVALHRGDLSIACEISVSSKAEYEARNLAKCLSAGFVRVFAVAGDNKRLRAIEKSARDRLSEDQLSRVDFLTPETVVLALDGLTAPAEEASVVKGYRVKVSRTTVGSAEARERRSSVAKVIAQAMRDLPEGG